LSLLISLSCYNRNRNASERRSDSYYGCRDREIKREKEREKDIERKRKIEREKERRRTDLVTDRPCN
jgi:hypothetical protein